MERDAQVGKDAVNALDAVIPQIVLEIGKIAVCKCKPVILQAVFPCVHVTVHAHEPAARAQTFHDGTTVAATAKGDVNIGAIGLYCESRNRLCEQRRYVINRLFHCYLFCYLVCLLNPSF